MLPNTDTALPSVMEFSEDVTTAEAPEPLPAGEYTAEIRQVEMKTSAAGTTYAAVSFFIPADQYPADYTDGNPDGTILVYRRVRYEDSPRGRYQTRKFCEAIGAPMGRVINAMDWIGLTAVVVIDHEQYEGELQARISRVLPA